mgnify:CR=1 FL=1|tara:strand:- start:594 stop:1091 length:498 start_codon:yes stop_codon:yes gene_type:complete
MGRIVNSLKFSLRLIPLLISGTYTTYRKLPDKSKKELFDVAKNPNDWGNSIEKAWDVSKITADNFKDTSFTLASIVLGRRISKERRINARNDLVSLSTIVPPLRVFMIPGSHILLGILARVTPWRFIPDEWIPINDLKHIREDNQQENLEKESRFIVRLLGRVRK